MIVDAYCDHGGDRRLDPHRRAERPARCRGSAPSVVCVAAIALALCSCGSSAGESGSGDAVRTDDEPTETAVVIDDPPDTSDDQSPTTGAPTPSTPSTELETSDDTDPPPGPSDNYDELLDFNRGELRTTYGDDRSDCTQAGAHLELAEAADGADVFLVCAHTAEPLTGSIRLIDPLGRSWAESRLSLDDNTETFGYTDYLDPPTFDVEARAVLIERDGELLPIGWSFSARDDVVTSAYLLVPVDRPSGAWTVEFGQETITSENIQGCTEPGEPGSPWITEPFDFLMFAEAQEPTFDNCRFVPDLVGLPAQEAATLAADVSVGSARADVVLEIRCDDGATGDFVVTGQGAQPGGLVFGDRLKLAVDGRCPETGPLLGMGSSEASAALVASWPGVLEPVIDTECQEDDVVTAIETIDSDVGPFVYEFVCDGGDASTLAPTVRPPVLTVSP